MSFFNLLKKAFVEWKADNASRLGAALSYYAIFSLAPFLLVLLGLASLAYQGPAAQNYLQGQIRESVGPDAAALIAQMLQRSAAHSSSVIAIAVGSAATLLGSTGIFQQLKGAVNAIWKAEEPKAGLRVTALRQLGLFGLVLVAGILLIASLVISTAISGASSAGLSRLMETAVSFLLLAALFGLLFKYLPSRHIPWRSVWPGAFATSFLFAVGKIALGVYFAKASVGSAYGAAGSLAVLLVWIYYAAQIFLYGVEIHKAGLLEPPSKRPEGEPGSGRKAGLPLLGWAVAASLFWLWKRKRK